MTGRQDVFIDFILLYVLLNILDDWKTWCNLTLGKKLLVSSLFLCEECIKFKLF